MNESKDIGPSYLALIDSDRVSAQTRNVLLQRVEPGEEPSEEIVLSADDMKTLQATAECVAPMTDCYLDFALRIYARLVGGKGKGWRYSELPPDLEAYRGALAALDRYARRELRTSFVDLPQEKQNQVLRLVESGLMEAGQPDSNDNAPSLNGQLIQRWFEDLRAEVTGIYMAHPGTLARIGYSGIADGAVSTELSGFVKLGLGEVEAWEPKAAGVSG